MLCRGEKARLVLAEMPFGAPNFLVLDEPTNHLDMATKEMLVAALAEFESTMLFVSHDRHFLAALSSRVLELTPDSGHGRPNRCCVSAHSSYPESAMGDGGDPGASPS